jgi:hypothetical protein
LKRLKAAKRAARSGGGDEATASRLKTLERRLAHSQKASFAHEDALAKKTAECTALQHEITVYNMQLKELYARLGQ